MEVLQVSIERIENGFLIQTTTSDGVVSAQTMPGGVTTCEAIKPELERMITRAAFARKQLGGVWHEEAS
jgi:hypothetical protein